MRAGKSSPVRRGWSMQKPHPPHNRSKQAESYAKTLYSVHSFELEALLGGKSIHRFSHPETGAGKWATLDTCHRAHL